MSLALLETVVISLSCIAYSENILDAQHYIGRIVKTLNRLFFLVGVDVQEWWNTTPRRLRKGKFGDKSANAVRLDQHFNTVSCPICLARKLTSACLALILDLALSDPFLQARYSVRTAAQVYLAPLWR